MNIYIHGLIGSPSNWLNVTNHIKGVNKCLEIDYIEPISEQITLIDNAIDKKNINNICIANSLGCLLSLKMADKFQTLILVAPPYKFLDGGAFMSESRIEELTNELFFDSSKIDKKELNETIDKWYTRFKTKKTMKELRRLKKELLEFNFREYYRLYQNKIHFVLGREDIYVPINDFLNMLNSTCPNAQVTIVDNCAHAVQIEKPEELIKIINHYNRKDI